MKRSSRYRIGWLLVFCWAVTTFTAAQSKRLFIPLDQEETRWVRFTTFFQLWARGNQNNPGTTVFDELSDFTTDVSLRRFRLALFAQPADRLFVFFQLGLNNLNYLSPRGTSLDLLDGYAEYTFSEGFTLGGGKSAWAGLSRYSAPNSAKHLSLDLPFVALPTLNATDDLTRKLSFHAKGKVGRLDYRLVLSKPLAVSTLASYQPRPVEGIANFVDRDARPIYSGYFKYELLDRESNRTFSHVGTYLGEKKILTIGAGFNFQPHALWSLDRSDTLFHHMHLLAADLFLDLPLHPSLKTALTVYAAFFRYDFGPNYIRLLGANNPSNGTDPDRASFNGSGNRYPVSGTGHTLVHQVGYLFPRTRLGQLQPYVSIQYSRLERLADPMTAYDVGINCFLNGHLSKFSFNVQLRPIFSGEGTELKVRERKCSFILQYQVRIE